MRKMLIGLLSFAAVLAILVGLLKVMHWLPAALQEGIMKKYASIEEVKSKLQLKEVYIPTYFPHRFAWPPSQIYAQSRPFSAVVMEFNRTDLGDTALVISQAASSYFTPDKKIAIAQMRETVTYSLKGRPAFLEVGTCKNEEPCCQISWDEKGYRIVVAIKSAPPDLIKIAESMVH